MRQLHSSIEAMRTDCNSTANRIVGVVERLNSRVSKVCGLHLMPAVTAPETWQA